MVQLDIYNFVAILSAVALAIMGMELIIKKIPSGDEFKKLRMARNSMAIAFALLVVFTLGEFSYRDSWHFETAMIFTASSGAAQCMLITSVLLACIDPAFITLKRVAGWLGITALWVVPFGAMFAMGISWAAYLTFAGYLIQLCVSFLMFRGKYKECISMIEATDESVEAQFRWVSAGFYAFVGLGLCAVVFIWLPSEGHIVFNILIVAFYTWFSSRFSSYAAHIFHKYYPVLTEAGLTDAEPEDTNEHLARENRCRGKVNRWVERKGYTKGDLSREDTAADMGLSDEDLRWYFAVCLKEDLRSWRVNLRIELVKEILEANPDAPINELAKSVGFTSRNNIYTHFKRYYGVTPREYCQRIQQKDQQKEHM